ncbi:hypothetical protein HpBT351_05360 [Helicobacter pylori]
MDFDLVGSSAKKDFQDALDFFDNSHTSKNNKNNYLKNAICLKNYLEKKRLQTLTISLDGCILRSYLSEPLAPI